MNRPRLLDLFCGAGGAAMGYHRAGFDVVGVDNQIQHRYPFLEILQADALAVLADLEYCRDFAVIHASPPCQAYSTLGKQTARRYPDMVGEVRAALQLVGRPYVIENVIGAPLRDPIMLCGSMFGLGIGGMTLRRHRLFESEVPLVAPGPDDCASKDIVGVYGTGGGWNRVMPGGGGMKVQGEAAATALGIDWTRAQADLAQAIPPAYTEWVGGRLLSEINGQVPT
jgi:DNA (cytosine-5)-methyltransferase 1